MGYAEWKPQMEIHLQRIGVHGVHRRPLTKEAWVADSQLVEQWEEDKIEAARALLHGGGGAGGKPAASSTSTSSTTSTSKTSAQTAEEDKALGESAAVASSCGGT